METCEINIKGCSLRLKTEHDKQTLSDLTSEVEDKVQSVLESHRHISLQKALLLTCLRLAENQLFLKKSIDEKLSHLEVQTADVLKSMNPTSSSNIDIDSPS